MWHYHALFCWHPDEKIPLHLFIYYHQISIRDFDSLELRAKACGFCNLIAKVVNRNTNASGNLSLTLEPSDREFQSPARVRVGPEEFDVPYFKEEILVVQKGTNGEEGVRLRVGSRESPAWDAIRDWLNVCRSKNASNANPGLQRSHGLTLIDVNTSRVTKAPVNADYAALNYVWGTPSGKPAFELTANNASMLEEPGSLLASDVPLTFQDAMMACARLGIPYRGIDRLCIAQDDDANKLIHIENMDVVYQNATITFVALNGESAENGLPGVSSRQRRSPKLLSIQGLEFWEDPELCFNKGLESSPWKQRGWTFQEALLPSRLLYFTNEQTVAISNVPGEDGWAETQLSPFKTTPFGETPMFEHMPSPAPARCGLMLPSYLTSQLEFSSRILTYSSDRVRAFSGILHAMYGEDHLFGLPFRHFDLALIWEGNCYKGTQPRPYLEGMQQFPQLVLGVSSGQLWEMRSAGLRGLHGGRILGVRQQRRKF